MTQSQNNKRLDLLNSYLEEDPNNPFLHFAMAQEYEKDDREDDALDRYLYLVEQHESYVGTYYHLGKLYERRQAFSHARRSYENGIEIAKKANDSHSASELQGALDLL